MRTKDIIELFERGAIFHYCGGLIRTPIYGVRKLLPENFHPMAYPLVFSPEYYHNTIQVLVNSIGGKAWINVRKHEVDITSIP